MTENVVNNTAVQSTTDAVSQPLFAESSTQQGPLGARRALNDGRVFRYTQFTSAAAVPAGLLVAPDVTSQFCEESAATTVRDSAGDAADINSSDTVTRLYFLDTDIFTAANSDDVFAGGYLHMLNSATGGYTHRIRSNVYTATTSVLQVDLYDSIIENITSESEMSISGSPYQNCVIANNGSDDQVSGLTVRNMTAAYYGWIQTFGRATVLADESVAAVPVAKGTIAVLSDGVNGAAAVMSQAHDHSEIAAASDMGPMVTEPIVGHFLGAATDANHVGIHLEISW